MAAAAGLFAVLTAADLQPLRRPDLARDAPVTVRGRVLRRYGEKQAVLQVERRLTPAGWVRERLGVVVRPDFAPQPGDLLEATGRIRPFPPPTNPGGIDARLLWLRRGASHHLAGGEHGIRLVRRAPPGPWQRAVQALRRRVLAGNRSTLPPRAALIANDFLIGDHETPDRSRRDRVTRVFRDSGTVHLLVVSGTQVTAVLAVFLLAGWRLWPLRWVVWPLGAGAVWLYWLLTDGDPAVSRAAVMGLVVAAALLVQRRVDLENCLGIAALVLLAQNRFVVFDPGAQLSFAAVWALIRWGPLLGSALGPPAPPADARPSGAASTLRRIWWLAAQAAAAAITAQLAVAPILAWHFQRSTWVGVLANLPMMLLGGLLLALASLHALLTAAGLPVLAPLVTLAAEGLHGWAVFFSTPPFGSQDVFPPPVWLWPLVLLAAPALGSLLRRGRGPALALTGCLALTVLLAERLPAGPPAQPRLRALDVGQGDAILLEGTDGSRILVDAGPEDAGPAVVRALRALRLDSLDALVLSHADGDHAGGAPHVLRSLRVGMFVHSGAAPAPDSSALWARVAAAAREAGVFETRLLAGDRLAVGRTSLLALGPLPAGLLENRSDNELSLVARWECAGRRVLVAGDLPRDREAELLRWGDELRADVLKVAHHGSSDGTGAALLRRVRPGLAVISCGRGNRYGHPAAELLDRLRAHGVAAARTDREGMVTVTLGADRLEVASFLPREAGDDSTAPREAGPRWR